MKRLLAKMEAYVDTMCFSHNQKKDNNKFINKKQPELAENRTVWKSDNEGDKEETFIQISRRGREDSQQGGSWQTQRGGGLWSRAGSAVAGQQGAAGRPQDPTFMHR